MPLDAYRERFLQNCDILLHLCHFMEDKAIVLFASSCDRREHEWLTWYNWHINTATNLKKPKSKVNRAIRKVLSLVYIPTINSDNNKYTRFTNDLNFDANFDSTRWFYAYYRRRQTSQNLIAGRFKKQMCQLTVSTYTRLMPVDINPWYALVKDTQELRLWLIQHNTTSKKNKHGNDKLLWKELTLHLSPYLFDGKIRINSAHTANRFIVAHVSIFTYNDVASVAFGDPIVSLAEIEAQHIRSNKSKANAALDEHSDISSTITPSKEQKSYNRNTILVWANAGNSSPNIVYFQPIDYSCKELGRPKLINIYNDWAFFKTRNCNDSYQRFDLFDLDGNRWAKGPNMKIYNSDACIQFASRHQCQLLVWKKLSTFIKNKGESRADYIQRLENLDSIILSLDLQWKVFNAQKDQYQCEMILSGRVSIPYCPSASIKVKTYTEKMCLIIVFGREEDKSKRTDNGTFKASLSLFVLGRLLPNDSAQSIFDARDYDKLLPIDSSDKGRVLWTRTIASKTIKQLYSEKLIVVQSYKKLDVLNARDGSLLRSIALLGKKHDNFWFIDMHTGRIYNPPDQFTGKKTKEDKDKILGLVATAQFSIPMRRHNTCTPSVYRLSSAVIGRTNWNGGGLYEAYML
ncbi:hypothetical protein BDF19DRAFT_447891 [Syncephalis fuscata]|nr:hypothetical protein BDF19DRAFT_447891 [Syncephalis fuscata]